MSEKTQAVVLALLLLLVAAGGALANWPRVDPGMRLTLWKDSPSAFEALKRLETQRLERLPAPSEFQGLVLKFFQFNQFVAGPAGRDSGKRKVVHDRFQKERVRFVEAYSEDAYVAVGAYLAQEFSRYLAQLQETIVDSGEMPAVWLTRNADHELVEALRALSADFLEKAIPSGLIRSGAPLEEGELWVVRTMWMQNWLLHGGRELLGRAFTRVEARTVLAWKIEAAQHIDLPRRLQLLEQMPQIDPEYPVDYVAGVLLAQEGDFEKARERLMASYEADEFPDGCRTWLLFIKREQQGL